MDQFKLIGGALAKQSGWDQGEVVRHFIQRLSVLLVKGNAALLISRIPVHTRPDVDGYM